MCYVDTIWTSLCNWTQSAHFRVPKITVDHTLLPPSLLVHSSRSSSWEVCDKQLLAAPVSSTCAHIYHRYIKKTGRHSVCQRASQMRRLSCYKGHLYNPSACFAWNNSLEILISIQWKQDFNIKQRSSEESFILQKEIRRGYYFWFIVKDITIKMRNKWGRWLWLWLWCL